jgi:pimeloyl-ACP methyl ester carboxylesterase
MECLVGEIPVYYISHGQGRPILMIHGFGPDHRLMIGCMEPLFKNHHGWQRIYFDLPGMGRTPGPEWLSNSDQMLDVVQRFADQVLPGEPYCVAGQSYGGYLARGLAARDSKRLKGMLLLCPAVYADATRRNLPKQVVLEAEPGLLEKLSPEERSEFESVAVIQTGATLKRYARHILPGSAAADGAFLERLKGTGYAFSFETDLASTVFEKPVLIVTGRQDGIVGYEDARDLAPCCPHATYAVLDRAGHNLQIEQPALFEALTGEWLERVRKSWKNDHGPLTMDDGR